MVSPPTYIHASAASSSCFFTGDAEALYNDLVKFHSNQRLDEKTYKHFKKLFFPCLITALLAAEEVFTMPLDVVVEAQVRTIRSTILKDSSTHILDLPISTNLLEPVVYHAEALIFSPYPSLTPPTSLSATVGTSAHHGASSSSAPTLMTDDQYAELSYLYLDYLK
ncbi:hypothetical protein Syun_027154 [Stephania yunnanensis]|uniref:Uncharacterized protein n=1 Tax=Stephania yunnanensis TaxID=152371 RepID=A0AAP0EMG0_9MAGN